MNFGDIFECISLYLTYSSFLRSNTCTFWYDEKLYLCITPSFNWRLRFKCYYSYWYYRINNWTWMYFYVVICNILMLFKNLIKLKIFLSTLNERDLKELNKNITQSEIWSGIPLFIGHVSLKKTFCQLIFQNNDTTMLLLRIYLSKGIKVKRCSGIK